MVHRKNRSASESLRKSDTSSSPKRPIAVRFAEVEERDRDGEVSPRQKTPRDQVEDDFDSSLDPLARNWRRKSVNIGSPLPGPQTQAKSFYDFVGVIGEYVSPSSS